MRLLIAILSMFLISGLKAQNYEICYPFNAGSFCDAKFICADEYYDGFCDFCPTYAPGDNDNFLTLLVYTFEVSNPGQMIDINLGGDWIFDKLELTLVGPFNPDSRCEDPAPATSQDFIEITNNGSIINATLSNSPGTYYIILSGGGFKDQEICPFIDIEFSPKPACAEDIAEPCESCIGTFTPQPNVPGTDIGRYLIGAWAKEENASPNKVNYDAPEIYIICDVVGVGPTTLGPFTTQGTIIDGWQRIEEEFVIPNGTTNLQIKLTSTSGNVYYDDIRFFPFDASMKSYVYDPINMRLSAELDERHYATFYEYDEEGKLVRIKKETEKGVMTIQETKSNSSK